MKRSRSPRKHRFSHPGYFRSDRAQDQSRPGKDGHRAWASWRRKIPTFRVHTDHDTGQTLISGMGELHLEIIVDRMMREFNVQANVGRPQVAYRETILKLADRRREIHSSRPAAAASTATQSSSVHPLPSAGHEDMHEMSDRRNRRAGAKASRARAASGISTRNIGCFSSTRLSAAPIPKEFIRADRKRRARSHGNRSSGGLRNGGRCRGRSIDGSYHDVDSSEMAFKIAGSMAFKEACRKANPKLLEPIMRVEVVVPGRIHGARSSRI